MAGKSATAKPSFYPLSPLQQGMLFHCLEAPGTGLYHEQTTLLFDGQLDLGAFEQAWRHVIERHEVLRTSFAWEGLKQPVQVVRTGMKVPLHVVDARRWALTEENGAAHLLRRVARAERGLGFELTRAPVWRLTLVRLPVERAPVARIPAEEERQRWGLLWSFSHLLLDGWSVPLLWHEVFSVYQAQVAGTSVVGAPVPGLPVVPPFRRYIAWLYRQDTSKAQSWWTRKMAGLRRPLRMTEAWGELDAGSAAAAAGGLEPSRAPTLQAHRLVPAAAVSTVRAWGREQGLTLNTLVQGAWALLASRYVQHDDVVFGIVVSGRPSQLPGVERMVGMFINTVPLRVQVPTAGSGRTVGAWVSELQRQAGEMQRFEHTPLAQIQSWSELPAREALFDFLLVFENQPRAQQPQEKDRAGLRAELLTGEPVSNYPLTLAVTPPLDDTHALRFHLTAHRGRVEESAMERLLGHLETLLLGLGEVPETPPAWLPMLTSSERRQLLELGSAPVGPAGDPVPADPVPADSVPADSVTDIVERVLAVAAERPEAVALSFAAVEGPDQVLTYGALDAASAALAARLRAAGVGSAEVTVALQLPRGVELAVAVLAVLRAGGAYVPLDVEQPASRLAFVLEDCGASVVVGEGDLAGFDGQVVKVHPRLFRSGVGAPPCGCPPGMGDGSGCGCAAGQAHGPAPTQKDWPPGALAYLIYTSGTTGTPKGVEVRRRNLSAFLDAVVRTFDLGADERLPCLAPHPFDIFGFELLAPWCSGGTAVLVPLTPILDLDDLVRRLPGFSRVHAVPALWAQLLDRLEASGDLDGLQRLRTVFVGGDVVPPALLRRLRQLLPRVETRVLYGPTEATVLSSSRALVPGAEGDAPLASTPAGGSLGRALPGVRLSVRDRLGRRLPLGLVGELVIEGAGVTRGYRGRPGQTAEVFVPAPRVGGAWTEGVQVEGTRAYRSGDRVRWRVGGTAAELEFLGRVDQQVKVRGFRIEPRGIEAVLEARAEVEQAVVAVRSSQPGMGGDAELVAWVVGEQVSVDVLRADLAEQLPTYMVPTRIDVLDAFPLTAHGKVDRKALLALPGAGGRSSAKKKSKLRLRGRTRDAETAAETDVPPLARQLCELFAEVLDVEVVGPHDDFFQLGGHSVLVMRLAGLLRARLQRDLPLRAIFDAPTAVELAAVLEAPGAVPEPAAGSAAGPAPGPVIERPETPAEPAVRPSLTPRPPLTRQPRPEDAAHGIPLSFAQERLWFLTQLDRDSPLYNVPMALELRGTLDVGAFVRAVHGVVRRHEVLRTSYPTVAGRPRQRIASVAEGATGVAHWAGLAYLDLSGLGFEAARDERGRLARVEAVRPFDLQRGPVMRVLLVRGTEVHTLLLTLHHIASDGWSTGVFVREFATLYKGETLPPLPVQYADYALWQRGWLDERALAAEVEHWRGLLSGSSTSGGGLPALDLPTDRPRPPLQTHRGAFVPLTLPAPLVASLEQRARESGSTLFMVLLTAFQALLGRSAGQRRLAVGTPVAGRHHEHLDGLIGFFVNTLVLAADLRAKGAGGESTLSEPTFRELLRRSRAAVLDAYDHQDVPFERLVAELVPQRDLARPALFQAMFALQTAPSETLRLPGLTLAPVAGGAGHAKFELTLTLTPIPSGPAAGTSAGILVGSLGFNTDLFDVTSMARLGGRLRALLAAVAADADARPALVPLLGAAETHLLLHEWRAVRRASTQATDDLAARIRAHGRRQPDAVAVRQVGAGVEVPVELSWRTLLHRAESQAASLQALPDWVPEARVAVCRPRSVQVVVDWLSVLLAGGAYVPLDPVHPAERLRLQVEDAGAVFVLGERAQVRTSSVEDVPVLARHVGGRSQDGTAEDVDGASYAQRAGGREGCRGARMCALPGTALAYVVYTSGSTGKPKGVAVSRRALGAMVDWKLRIDALAPGDRVAFASGLSFDAAATDVWPALVAGATVCLPTATEEAEPARMLDWVLAGRLHVVRLGTPMVEAMLDRPLPASAKRTLRTLVTGGDRLRKVPQGTWRGVLFNRYGPSEATVQVSRYRVAGGRGQSGLPTLGRPVDGTALWILDARQRLQPIGVPGELVIASIKLARGYLGRPALTAAAFRPNPFALPGADPELDSGSRIYRSGDLARTLEDGELEFLGRIDHQVQLRGYRVELGEIETVLTAHPSVAQAVVLLRGGLPGGEGLVAYVETPQQEKRQELEAKLRDYLRERLPVHMIPAAFVLLDAMPVTPNGKFDRTALLALSLPGSQELSPRDAAAQEVPGTYSSPTSAPGLERRLIDIWRRVLGVPHVRRTDNFFDLGGHSLLLIELQHHVQADLGVEVPVVELFQFPTVATLAAHLGGGETMRVERDLERVTLVESPVPTEVGGDAVGGDVAIIGMAGRFPGAPDLDAFWQVLRDGVETVSRFTREELLANGVRVEELEDPDYVPARGRLSELELFDASFFDYAPREAQVLDPQFRLFLELAWHALEDAGYDPGRARKPGGPGRVAVFGGGAAGTYRWHFGAHPEVVAAVGSMQVNYATNPQFLPTQVAYKLGLEGPAIDVQTACSTGLVSLHLACQALADGSCDMALAGGVAADTLGVRGYRYQYGGISAKDGHCRSYDAEATGSVMSNGAGMVLLKPLAAARRDGDRVLAVVRGSALNNDGHRKVGYTAPSVEGQAEAIRAAHRRAGVPASTIQFVEGHGSATPLGDPVEVQALKLAFGDAANGRPIVLSSVKSNQGHADTAAGIAGLLKTVLALRHRQLPPTVHFQQPNPQMGLDSSCFEVSGELTEWPENRDADGTPLPRRAGVSSFGIGGTNAHVVLEEASVEAAPVEADQVLDSWRLLVLSARSEASLASLQATWAQALDGVEEAARTGPAWNDWSYTALVGRAGFELRRAFVARDGADAAAVLRGDAPGRLLEGTVERGARPSVAFLLAGVGDQYPGMAAGLYHHEPVFRAALDRCADLLASRLDVDLRQVLFPEGVDAYLTAPESADSKPDLRALLGRAQRETTLLDETRYLQPAVFAVDYALAQLWQSWGVEPVALLGYSLGEYVAACLAGVLTLEDALTLVAERARLLEALPAGAMLAVSLPEARLRELLAELPEREEQVELAAINGPELCVVAGTVAAVEAFAAHLAALDLREPVVVRRLPTSHAFHTSHMQPAAAELRQLLESLDLQPPRRPLLSNVTGTWARPEEVTTPDYWLRHLVQPVRFADALAELWQEPGVSENGVLLEVGPGHGLGSLALQQVPPVSSTDEGSDHLGAVFASLRHSSEPAAGLTADRAFALTTLAKLWLCGVEVDAQGLFHASTAATGRQPRRARLPLYPFDRQRYWLEASVPGAGTGARPSMQVLTGEAAPQTSDPATAPASRSSALPPVSAPPVSAPPAADKQQIRRRPGQAAFVAPSTPLQQRLASIWGDLLGVEDVGLHDSFFELGGHSLLGTRLMARLRSELDVELDLSGLFDNPTVEGQAARIEELWPGAGSDLGRGGPMWPPSGVVGGAHPKSGPAPLSYAQERMWFLHRLDPDSPAYNIPAVYRVLGLLRADLCARALEVVVARQAVLRTCYGLVDGDLVQRTDLPLANPPLVDLRELAGRDRRAVAECLASREVVRPFDLEHGPAFRFTLLRHGLDEHAVLVTVHHIGADGWSLGVLIREFATAYGCLAESRDPAEVLAPLPWQYTDFASWQRQWMAERLEEQLAFWRTQLDGVPILELPTDRPRPARPEPHGRRRERLLPASLLAGVRELAARSIDGGAGATDFVVLLAAFQALLARWRLPGTDVDGAVEDGRRALRADLSVGTPIAGRRQLETEPLIGFFVNTLVLRRQVDLGAGLADHVRDARRIALGAFDHQDVPFERLVDELQPERNLRTTPLFQVLFALQNAPPPSASSPGLRLAPQPYTVTTVRFDLEVSLFPARQLVDGELAETLVLSVGYRTSLFDTTTIDRFARAFETLLRGALEDPARSLASVPLLAAAERHQVLVEVEDTLFKVSATDSPEDETLDVLFRRVAQRVPDSVALHFGRRHLSYREFDRHSDLQAAALSRRLAGSKSLEPIVALRLERSPELFVALLASVKAGAMYLPLDPQYPEERVTYMLEDSGALVVGEGIRAPLHPTPAPDSLTLGTTVSVEAAPSGARDTGGRSQEETQDSGIGRTYAQRVGGREGCRGARACALPSAGTEPCPDSPAYLLYTSGSTGRPKGVLVTHRGVSRLLLGNPYMPFTSRLRIAQLNNTAFDASTIEIWGAWLHGGTLVGVPRQISQDAAAVPGYLHRWGVEMAMIPSALFAHLARTRPEVLDGIPYINIGGEAADREACRRFLARTEGRRPGRLLNGYGPTECTVYSQVEILYPTDAEPTDDEAPIVAIGRSVAATEAVLLPPGGPVCWHEPLPLGVAGELCLGGARLARGYHRRFGLTAERFVPHPFPSSSRGGDRLYRTGDLVRMLGDGRFDYLGRLDHQIQLRGFRVELGEIEAVLRGVEGVEEAVVLVHGEGEGRYLVAYVVAGAQASHAESGATPHVPEGDHMGSPLPRSDSEVLLPEVCLDVARAGLPDYMVPRHIVPLAALPLNAHGKTDRAALAAIELQDPRSSQHRAELDRTAPRDEVEALLVRVWAKLLDVGEVGVHADFFRLGGHSLLAASLLAEAESAFGVHVSLAMFFEQPTIASLARHVRTARERRVAVGDAYGKTLLRRPPLVSLDRREIETDAEGRPVLPQSYAQQRLWFLDRLEPGLPTYHIAVPLRFRGDLDVAGLHATLEGILARHEALRTTFAQHGAEAVQVIHPPPRPGHRQPLPLIDLGGLVSGADPGTEVSSEVSERVEVELERLAAAEARRPFDLTRDPMLRVVLVRLPRVPTEATAGDEGVEGMVSEHGVLATLHHIASDGWSVGVLVKDVAMLYQAWVGGEWRGQERRPLPPVQVQYADYAVWQRRWLETVAGEPADSEDAAEDAPPITVLDRQLDYWRTQLTGAPTLDLPLDRPRPPRFETSGSHALRILPARLARRLEAFALDSGNTLFVTLLTAFEVLLLRWTGQADISVGTPVAGRTRAEVEPLIGFFVNTLVLRGRLDADASFRDAQAQLRNVVLTGQDHGDVPFERVVEALQPPRDRSRTPLFQVLFTLQTTATGRLDLPGLDLRAVPLRSGVAKFDLEVQAQPYIDPEAPRNSDGEVEATLLLNAGFRSRLFDTTTIERLLGHCEVLLESIVEAEVADLPLRRLPLLSRAERHQLCVESNDTHRAYPDDVSLATLVRRTAERFPDAVAVLYPGGTDHHLSYRELIRRADLLATALRQNGVGPDVLVALDLERSPELIVATVGVILAGGAYLPLNRNYPQERLDFQLRDAGVEVVVGEGGIAIPATSPGHPSGGAPTSLNLAYTLYTSGSTGRPKGVAVTQQGVARLLLDNPYADFGPGRRFCQVANFGFDAATFEVWGALLHGGCVVGVPRDLSLAPARLARFFAEHRVDAACFTSALFHQTARSHPETFAGLRDLLVGGEAVEPEASHLLLRSSSGGGFRGRLANAYGPTECTVIATVGPVTLPDVETAADQPARGARAHGRLSIGRPIANTEVFLLDPHGELVVPGVAGELYLGGPGLARGYLGRPALTADAFVPHPFTRESGSRLYKTGDLVRRLPDGRLDFLGRRDHQVKLRGFRIELGEIEMVLRAQEGVEDAVVLVRGEGDGRYLVAYVVGPVVGRDLLAATLPDYMVPRYLVPLDAFPLTANGKLDRRALPDPDTTPRDTYVAPRSELEEDLAELWAELLAVERVGVEDDFFELGGHSMLAMQLMSHLEASLGFPVPLEKLFSQPTIAALAVVLEDLAEEFEDD